MGAYGTPPSRLAAAWAVSTRVPAQPGFGSAPAPKLVWGRGLSCGRDAGAGSELPQPAAGPGPRGRRGAREGAD